MKKNSMFRYLVLAGLSFSLNLQHSSFILGAYLLLGQTEICQANIFKKKKKSSSPPKPAELPVAIAAMAPPPAPVVVDPVVPAAGDKAAVGPDGKPLELPAPVVKLGVYDRTPITFGAVVRFKHAVTGKYLTASNDTYIHEGSSLQPAVYGGTDGAADAAHWIIKGRHFKEADGKVRRWQFDLDKDERYSSMSGWPVKRKHIIRLENVATGKNLHSDKKPSPISKQGEVTNFGLDGCGDDNDNFEVANNDTRSGWFYLASGYAIQLKHSKTGIYLSSKANTWWQKEKQEVSTYKDQNDTNSWWIPEIVAQPFAHKEVAKTFKNKRESELNYWKPLFWDTESDNCTENYGEHRAWTHGASLHDGDGKAKQPHDHMEIILGPWGDDRARRGPSMFVMHKADDKANTGAVQFGDRVKIMALHGGKGEAAKTGLLRPFRYVWVHEWDTKKGQPYRDLVVTRPEHAQTQDDGAEFIVEPILEGQSGAVSSMDLVRLKNVKTKAYLWTHRANRFGKSFWEILATKEQEDQISAAKDGFAPDRRLSLEKFRFSEASHNSLSDDAGRADYNIIKAELKEAVDALKAIAKVEKQNDKLEDKIEELRLKAEEAKTAAKAQAEEAKAAAKAEIEKAKEAAEKAKAEVLKEVEELKAAQKEELAKIKAENNAADFPVGFIKIPGKAKQIALGLQDKEDKKTKEKTFDDFAVITLEDGSLAQFVHNDSAAANPWERVNLVDADGAAVKVSQVAVGMDGTTYAISADGKKLFGITWPEDVQAKMPDPAQGFAAAYSKDEERLKKAKKSKKNKNKKKKHGKASKGRGRGLITELTHKNKVKTHKKNKVGKVATPKKKATDNKDTAVVDSKDKDKKPESTAPVNDKAAVAAADADKAATASK